MDNEKRTILIPWDFTPVADYALLHGQKIAKGIGSKKIALIHITKKEKDNADAMVKLEQVAKENAIKMNLEIEPLVREGSIFTTIGEVASDVNAELVIMGTHGLHGMQKLTGSWALKVIVSSKVPFVVVQEPPKDQPLKDIVFPIDFKWENKEKLNWASYFYNYFSPKFHILKPNTTDVGFINKIKANITFARKFMEGKGISYELYTVDGAKNFAVETIDFAKNMDADLILIVSTKNIGFSDYMLGASEQYIIANSAKIPVMVINPREDLTKFEGFN
jgi:nucleotide-binding universal stress UspA family protein